MLLSLFTRDNAHIFCKTLNTQQIDFYLQGFIKNAHYGEYDGDQGGLTQGWGSPPESINASKEVPVICPLLHRLQLPFYEGIMQSALVLSKGYASTVAPCYYGHYSDKRMSGGLAQWE